MKPTLNISSVGFLCEVVFKQADDEVANKYKQKIFF